MENVKYKKDKRLEFIRCYKETISKISGSPIPIT